MVLYFSENHIKREKTRKNCILYSNFFIYIDDHDDVHDDDNNLDIHILRHMEDRLVDNLLMPANNTPLRGQQTDKSGNDWPSIMMLVL